VVAPRSGGAPDVVRHLETGLLYEPDDEQGLAEAVASVTADRQRALLGARGRELSTRTWRDAVDELVDRHYAALVVPAGSRT
jgi:phosphatidylinositol alpha 1,6-mannosyltransferase